MARHNVSLDETLSERVKRRAKLDGQFHLSWFVQEALGAELDRWEAERLESGLGLDTPSPSYLD